MSRDIKTSATSLLIPHVSSFLAYLTTLVLLLQSHVCSDRTQPCPSGGKGLLCDCRLLC